MYYNDQRSINVEIFEDTIRICQSENVKESLRKSIDGQIFIGEQVTFETTKSRYTTPARIVVSNKRTIAAAAQYKGEKICILNFASATNPGGGVTRGSNAQEECICRITDLYPCLDDKQMLDMFYHHHKSMLKKGKMTALYNDDCIFTPDVCVLKSDTKEPVPLAENEIFSVDVITCAAPNLREKTSNKMNSNSGNTRMKISDAELKALHTKRANRILDIAKSKGEEVIILGAFGCGAFQNPPQVVAEGIKAAVESHIRDFKCIEFAVFCGRDDLNFRVFKKVFGDM